MTYRGFLRRVSSQHRPLIRAVEGLAYILVIAATATLIVALATILLFGL